MALLGRQLAQKFVGVLKPDGIFVDDVEEDRVHQLSEDLGGRRVANDLRLIRFGKCFFVVRRQGEDPRRTKVQRRRQRRGEADPAVAVPVPAKLYGRKDERQGRRGHHMIDGQFGQNTSAQRALPRFDAAARGPCNCAASVVIECRHGDRSRLAARDVLREAGNFAVFIFRIQTLQKFAQRLCVDQPLNARSDWSTAGSEPRHPCGSLPQQRRRLDLKDVLQLQSFPDSAQFFDNVRELSRVRSEEHRVDRAGGDAGDDVQLRGRYQTGKSAKHAHLIRRARTAAGEHDGEVVAVHERRLW